MLPVFMSFPDYSPRAPGMCLGIPLSYVENESLLSEWKLPETRKRHTRRYLVDQEFWNFNRARNHFVFHQLLKRHLVIQGVGKNCRSQYWD